MTNLIKYDKHLATHHFSKVVESALKKMFYEEKKFK